MANLRRIVKHAAAGVFLAATCFSMFAVRSCADEVIFEFEVIETRLISGFFSVAAGQELSVAWGDGTSEKFSGHRAGFHKDFGADVRTKVRISAGDGSALQEFRMTRRGANIAFELKDLPKGLVYFVCEGANTVAGDISDLPEGLRTFVCTGNNTVSGDISGLPASLTYFDCRGRNTIRGDVSKLPGGLTYFSVMGRNTLTGNVADLPESLNRFDCLGNNRLSGDIGEIPRGLEYFRCHGNNVISGNLAGLPGGLSYLGLRGDNTAHGDFADLPRGIVYFHCLGENTLAGDLDLLPPGVTDVFIRGQSSIRYSGGREWAADMREVSLEPYKRGLSSKEVDELLADLSATTWDGRKVVRLAGINSSRTSASDSAFDKLERAGVTVHVSPPLPGGTDESVLDIKDLGISVISSGDEE